MNKDSKYSNPVSFTMTVKVIKIKDEYDLDEYTVEAEGSGFVGEATGHPLSRVFEDAYQDLMCKVAAGVFV